MRGDGADDDPYAEDWDDDPDDRDEPAPPYWFAGQHLPDDARRMGLTHHVPDGAILDLAGRLDASKPRHLIAAWVMLAVFGLPVVLAVLRLFYAF
jgi:hypothetical protein